MAQSGYTPIQLYYSTTAAAVPVNTNLVSGELALNIQDEKLYFKNAAGTVKLLASNATSAPVTSFQTSLSGLTPSTATTGAVTLAGTLGTANGGTGLTSFTSGGVVYASNTTTLATGSGLVFDATNGLLGLGISSGFRTAAGYGIQAINGSTGALIDLYTGGVRLGGVFSTGVSTGISSITATPLTFSTNDTERGRFDTAGAFLVGITSNGWTSYGGISEFRKDQNSPSLVTVSNQNSGSSGSAGTLFTAYGNSWVNSIGTAAKNSNALTWALDATASPPSVKMALDTSANLGINNSSPAVLSSTTQVAIKANSSADAMFVAQNSNGLTTAKFGFQFTGGVDNPVIGSYTNHPFIFQTNNTERMRLDTSGNLGVGTTSPRAKLDVSGSALVGTYQTSSTYATLNVKPTSTITTPSTFTNAVNIWNGTNVGEYSNITFGYNTLGLFNASAYMGYVCTSTAGNSKGDLVFGTRDVTTDTAATERVRIDSAGTFIIKNDYQEQTYTANSSTAITLNITTNGTDQVITLTGSATITMPTAVAGKSFLLKLKTGAGGYTVTWSTVKWPGGTAPTLTSTASKMDIFSFFSDGTNWYGCTVGQNYTP